MWVNMRYWTQEQKNELLRHARAGKSGTQIANILSDKYELPMTRSMVIGMAARLGTRLTSRVQRSPKRPLLPKRSPVGVTKEGEVAKEPEEPMAPIEMSPCTIYELTQSKCKYPLWPDPVKAHNSYLYCGAKPSVGPYCAAHAAVAYRPLKPSTNLRHL